MEKKSRLNKLMSLFGGGNVLEKMGSSILPMVLPMAKEHLEQLNKPEDEGGLKKEGEDYIGYIVIMVNDKPILTTAAISINEKGNPELVRNIATIGMDQLENIQNLINESEANQEQE